MKHEFHNLDVGMMMTNSPQTTLLKLAHQLFGKDVETRWVETYVFPIYTSIMGIGGELQRGMVGSSWLWHYGTKPSSKCWSWRKDRLGFWTWTGATRNEIIYQIPDIRLFPINSMDQQYTPIIYKSVSQHPACINDISFFWLPQGSDSKIFSSNDFYDLVRSIGGELVEQVSLVDEFYHKKKQRWSHSYRIVYRQMSKALTQDEANKIHSLVEQTATKTLAVDIR